MRFRESAFEALTNSGFLNATPVETRDNLLTRFAHIVEEIDDFLQASRDHHRAGLMEKKNELWGQGRALEERLLKIRNQQADLRASLRSFEMETVAPARLELDNAKARKPNSQFPTAEERAQLVTVVNAVKLKLMGLESETVHKRSALRTSEADEAAVIAELNSLIQKVAGIDDELKQ